jgi:hypothetical protein
MEFSTVTLNRRKFCSNLRDKIEQLMDTLGMGTKRISVGRILVGILQVKLWGDKYKLLRL